MSPAPKGVAAPAVAIEDEPYDRAGTPGWGCRVCNSAWPKSEGHADYHHADGCPLRPSATRIACRPRIDVRGIEACTDAANIIGQLAAENDALRAELATRPTVAAPADPLLLELIAALGWQGGNREQALNAVRELRAASVRS